MINIPINEPAKEVIAEDELDEFLREFESYDETQVEKSKSMNDIIQNNENTKNNNSNDIEITSIHGDLKESLSNEESKKMIEDCKENKNIDDMDMEFFDFFVKESNNNFLEEVKIVPSPAFRNTDMKNENQIAEPEKDQIKKIIDQNDYTSSKKSPKNEKNEHDQKEKKEKNEKKERKKERKKEKTTITIDSVKNKEYETKNEIVNDKYMQKTELNKNKETLKVSKIIESPKSTNSKNKIQKKHEKYETIQFGDIAVSADAKNIKKNTKKISIDQLEDETKSLDKDPKKSIIKKKIKSENGEKESNKTKNNHKSQNTTKSQKLEYEITQKDNEVNGHFILRKQYSDNDNLEKMFGTPKHDDDFMVTGGNTPDIAKNSPNDKFTNDQLDLFSQNQNKNSYKNDNLEDSFSEELYGTPIIEIKKEEKVVKHVISNIEEKKEITQNPEDVKENPKGSMETEFKIKKRKETKEDLHNNVHNGNNDCGSKVSSVSTRHTEGSFKVMMFKL